MKRTRTLASLALLPALLALPAFTGCARPAVNPDRVTIVFDDGRTLEAIVPADLRNVGAPELARGMCEAYRGTKVVMSKMMGLVHVCRHETDASR